MRTPKEYNNNMKNGIITMEMLGDCIFSVNKRAKNCRDKERKYRNRRYDKYDTSGSYRQKKEEYYNQKEIMLSICHPTCIHTEMQQKRCRVYDYEPDYEWNIETYNVVHEGYYIDKFTDEYVCFSDVIIPTMAFYLFYDMGNHSFHTPINECDVKEYGDLPVIDIGTLITSGANTSYLLSTQFVGKVLALRNKYQKILFENIK